MDSNEVPRLREGHAMKPTTRLRQRLAQPGLIVAPGAFDGLSAKLIEQAGFDVVYATGGGISRSCGYPDIGLLTMTEVLMHLRWIVETTSVPVIGDCDTGYGNALNVMRAVREFERVGVAAFHLEDQITPKRCGHYEGKEVVSCEEMCKKLEAALEARTDPDLVIIARTDARAMHGLAEAIRRGQEYAKVGADMIFVEAPRDRDELKRIADEIAHPLVANMVKGGKTPFLSASELEALGYKLAIFASDVQRAAIYGMRAVLQVMQRDGSPEAYGQTIDFPERDAIIGLAGVQQLEERYLRP
jgi:carboxyvinyl-carboxyphosphonate phosphorylmutase